MLFKAAVDCELLFMICGKIKEAGAEGAPVNLRGDNFSAHFSSSHDRYDFFQFLILRKIVVWIHKGGL